MTEPSEESSEAPETTVRKYKIILGEHDPGYSDYDRAVKYEISLHELSLSYNYASGANEVRTEYAMTKWGARRKAKGILKRYIKSQKPGFYEEYDEERNG